MKKAAMNRKKRLDAPSKQELRERYESARRQNAKEDSKDDLSSTSELPKRPREDAAQDIDAQSSDLRDKIPKLSRTIAGNNETGSLVVNVGKTNPSAQLSLVDPSYDDSRMSVEMFDYSHKRADTDTVGDDGDDLRSLIERQRKTDVISKKDDQHSKKSGSTFFDSGVGYNKDQSKTKMSDSFRDSKRKESKDSKSSSGKSERYSKHDVKSKSKKGKGNSMSSYELGFPFFSGSAGSKDMKKNDKPAKEMDINETLKELAYLRSIQTGDNALPKEEEEYFRKLNDLSKPILSSQLDQIITGTNRKSSSVKVDGATKISGENLSKFESKWESVIDSMDGTKTVGNSASDNETYGPSLPPKKSSSTSKTAQDSNSTERKFSKERSLSRSKSDPKTFPVATRGVRGGRGFRGRGVRGGFRGRGRGRGRGEFDVTIRGRGRGRSRGRFIRGGFVPSRGRHVFAKQGSSRRRSSSGSRSRSSSFSSSRSRSRSRGRGSNKRRRRSSSRSSYSSSSYSRSRSRSRDRGRGKRQTRRRSRSRSYSSRSRSRSRSPNRSRNRSRSRSRSTTHSRSRKRSRSRSRSKSRGRYKKQSKDRARSRSKSSSRSRSRKRKERSRSWSFDEDYTKKKNMKITPNTRETKTFDGKGKAKKEQETKIQSKPKKEKTVTEIIKDKNDKTRDVKLVASDQTRGKTSGKIAEHATKKTHDKPKAENPSSPAVVALKDLKVTAFSNVFLPRTVSKTVGNMSKGISIGKGRMLPLKKHPVFDTQEDELQEEAEKIDPKELERMKEQKHKFDKEVDKVFNVKQESKDVEKKRGGWKRVWPPEESPKKEETQQQEQEKLQENKYEEIEGTKVVEDQRIVESKDAAEEKKTDKEQKKEKKEKKRKDKEEKSKRKKEKKEKKEKKNKEPVIQEGVGNEKEKALVDDGQALLDSSRADEYNQEGYSGYNESFIEYPEGEYPYYEEAGQEQGWYDENGVYHPFQEEEEYLYYYDQEGNIVGYEGPEGYVEGNPFEEQQYSYEGEPQEGVHPDVYGQEAYGTQYTGDAEGSYQYRETGYPVEGQAFEGEQYTDTGNHWEEYADIPDQQWYGAEGTYPDGGEGYTEYQYAEGQEGANQYAGGIEQQVPGQQDLNYMVQQEESSQIYAAPGPPIEEPKAEGEISENEIVLALGKNLAALARLKGWNQQELLDKDPVNLVQMLQKPSLEKSAVTAQREMEPEEPRRQSQDILNLLEPNRQIPQQRKLDELPRQHLQERKAGEGRMQYPQERKPGLNVRRVAEPKPLKSILKKGNSASLKPPPKTETTSGSPLAKIDPGTATNDHVGPEYIVRISKSGPERFFCKLCQCHIESTMAKELHVKSMKHIELFVREKSALLDSVIGAKQSEDTAIPERSAGSDVASQQDKLPEKREASPLGSPDKRDYHESRDTSEEDPARNRLLDYDRLRLRGWHRREESGSLDESEKMKQFDYGRTDDPDYESRITSDVTRGSEEQERYEDRNEHSRWPRVDRQEADWRQDGQGYGREHQHYASGNRERDYHREQRSLSHDLDRRDDRGSVGSRSSNRSVNQSEKDYRSRMQQDVRPSARDRPEITQDESSNNQRTIGRSGIHREQPSRQEQIPGRDGSDKSRHSLTQSERGGSRGDASRQGRGRTSFPQENREQAQEERRHGQASRQDNTRQDPNQKAQETSIHSTGSSRSPSSKRKEIPRGESAGVGRGRADENAKNSERISQSSPAGESNHGKQSKDNDSNRNSGLKDRDLSAERDQGRAGNKPLPRIQNQKEVQEENTRTEESQAQVPVSEPLSAALLGAPPRSHTEDQKPQEEVKSISTVIQGQRRVPPPPPPYSKGSGPQSFRGRGHPPLPGGRGGHSRMPPNQPGMMRNTTAPLHSLSMPPQATTHNVGAPLSGMPPRKHFPGDQSMGDHSTPPYYGRGRAVGQSQFRGRGGSPHMSRGAYGGPPQFTSRGRGGRGGRGFHGQ